MTNLYMNLQCEWIYYLEIKSWIVILCFQEGEDKRYLMTKLAELGGTPQVIRPQDDRKPAGSGEEYVTDDETREAASALISDETIYSETDETRPPRAVITDDVWV